MAIVAPSLSEHRVLRDECGLVDRSERGKLALTGDDAAEFLNGQITNDVQALFPGEGCYAALLTPKGKMLADLRAIRPGEGAGAEALWLDTERSALQALWDTLRRFRVGYSLELHKRTLEQALLSLIGPRARVVAGVPELPGVEHANLAASLGGCPVTAIATDTGVDVVCWADDRRRVHQALVDAGASPVSEEAAECLRVERGRPRYGHDMDDSTIPQEAGLNERAVSFSKGCYVGQETVARLFYRGKPNRLLRGLELSALAPSGAPLRLGERPVGSVGSVAAPPDRGPIALGLVRREAGPGDTLEVGEDGVTATVRELPFGSG